MKKCSKCGIEKEFGSFPPQAKGKDGLMASCKECNNARGREWYRQNPERAAASRRAYAMANAEEIRAYSKAWREENAERLKAQAAAWTTANLGKKAAATARRRAAKLRATPHWANHEFMKKFYECAERVTQQSGVKAQVDHIVPLQSKIVCGLHNHFNLTIITEWLNKSKGNLRWPDMP
jgi:5-methylcytosine-specific restriction endonuclease McrA